MTDIEYKYYLIELIPRVFCGIIFLFQGYDKLFKVKIQGVVETFLFETQHRYVPKFLLQGMAVFASNVEFIGGALLIVGLFKTAVLALFGIDLIFVAIAFSYMNPIWDMKHVFPRLILILMLFVMPDRWNYFSLDHLFFHHF